MELPLSVLYELADDSPLKGFDSWGLPFLLSEQFPDSICTDVRKRRGTPGLVPYDAAFAKAQQRRWWEDSMTEQNWAYGRGEDDA